MLNQPAEQRRRPPEHAGARYKGKSCRKKNNYNRPNTRINNLESNPR